MHIKFCSRSHSRNSLNESYTGLVHPYIKYCSSLWDTCGGGGGDAGGGGCSSSSSSSSSSSIKKF